MPKARRNKVNGNKGCKGFTALDIIFACRANGWNQKKTARQMNIDLKHFTRLVEAYRETGLWFDHGGPGKRLECCCRSKHDANIFIGGKHQATPEEEAEVERRRQEIEDGWTERQRMQRFYKARGVTLGDAEDEPNMTVGEVRCGTFSRI